VFVPAPCPKLGERTACPNISVNDYLCGERSSAWSEGMHGFLQSSLYALPLTFCMSGIIAKQTINDANRDWHQTYLQTQAVTKLLEQLWNHRHWYWRANLLEMAFEQPLDLLSNRRRRVSIQRPSRFLGAEGLANWAKKGHPLWPSGAPDPGGIEAISRW
jgi:hypothetical protein